jgi:hypothetical protein
MKIAVVGAGIFGVTAALKLSEAGHQVDLYEKNKEILSAASGINQYRLHRGYHYPRSKSTALASKYAEDSFKEMYGECVISGYEHYYSIAKEGSKVTGQQFLSFCKECELEHEQVDLSSHVHPDHIDLTIRGVESLFDPVKLKELAAAKLEKSAVTVWLGETFMPHQLDEYDMVVNCTYANSNFILERFPNERKEYQFEVVEKPILQLPQKYEGKSIVVMDGPFFCIDPYSTTGYHVMGNVVHAIHATNVGEFPIVPEEIKPLLNKGIIRNPPVTNIEHFLKVAAKFMPDLKDAVHIGSMYTVRTVLPNVDKTDERPTVVSKLGDKIIHVFSGKIGNCVDAANEVVRLVKS